MRDFRKLEIWELGMDLTCRIYQIANDLPETEKYGLRSQMTRAEVSIPSNIAEGTRGSKSELIQFVKIAVGSCNEFETQVRICSRIELVSLTEASELLNEIVTLRSKMLKFIQHLKKSRVTTQVTK